jgi:hypothetical protein
MNIILIVVSIVILLIVILLYIILLSPQPLPQPSLQPSSSKLKSQVKSESLLQVQSLQKTSGQLNATPIIQNTDTNTDNTNITCNILNNPESIKCIDPQSDINYPTYITIINDDIIQISSSINTTKSNRTTTDYYIILPYSFLIDYPIELSTNTIVLNTLDDLLLSFNNIGSNFKTNSNLMPGKCLNVTLDKMTDDVYKQTCLFFNPAISQLPTIIDTITLILLPYLPASVLNDYYNLLDSTIKNTKTLTIFQYIMYLALLNNVKQKKYFSQCNSIQTINC